MTASTPSMSPQEARQNRNRILIGIGVGIIYGLTARFLFGIDSTSSVLSTLSGAFLLGVPFILGAVVVFLLPPENARSWRTCVAAPILPGGCFLVVVGIIGWELSICVLMAMPIFLIFNAIGGLVMCAILKLFRRRDESASPPVYALAVLAALPFAAAPIEQTITIQHAYHTVHTQIAVNAAPHQIWEHIVRVPAIAESEHRPAFFALIGIPRPVEASLTADGVGGIREATFDNGLAFIEHITLWEENKRVAFTIDPDTSKPIPAPFGVIDGAPYELIDAIYTIEPLPDGTSILHLTSTQRISTRFNFYSGWWSNVLMSDLQYYILEIVKARIEAATAVDPD